MKLINNSNKRIWQKTWGIIIILFCFVSFFLNADENMIPDNNTPTPSVFDPFDTYQNNQEGNNDPFIDEEYMKELIKKKYDLQLSLMEVEYGYKESIYKHRMTVFNYQFISSIIIFGMVLIIVAVGLIFSGFQLFSKQKKQQITKKQEKVTKTLENDQAASNNSQKKSLEKITEDVTETTESNQSPQDDSQKTSLKVSKEGIEIQSSVIGLIILLISLVFFYLYLTFVYPIKELEPSVKTEQISTQQ